MAKMYQYYELDGFPQLERGKPLNTGKKLAEPMFAKEEPHTTITYLGSSDHEEFDKYFVQHESRRDYIWRYDNERRRGGLILVDEFHLYRHRNQGYFLIDSTHPDIREMCRRLRSVAPEMKILIKNVDLPSVIQKLSASISGGHFGSLNIERVSAASIFGPDVGESNMWDYFTEHGELNALLIRLTYLGETQTVMVSKLGGVMPYHTYGENATLDIVKDVSELIEPYSEIHEYSVRSRRKR